jgi:hypothetical protein
MKTMFLQQNGARPHTANVVLDVLHDVRGNHVLSNRRLNRALRVWVVLATMVTGHESLRLFPLGLPQRSCVPHQSAYCLGGVSGD